MPTAKPLPIGDLPAEDDSSPVDPRCQPYWIPDGVEFEGLPANMRRAIRDVIDPTYQELVLSARPGLAQSTGLTIVHLLWLEMVDHIDLSVPPTALDDPLAILDSPHSKRAMLIERHLRTIGAKLKASDLLLRIQKYVTKEAKDESMSLGLIPPVPGGLGSYREVFDFD